MMMIIIREKNIENKISLNAESIVITAHTFRYFNVSSSEIQKSGCPLNVQKVKFSKWPGLRY